MDTKNEKVVSVLSELAEFIKDGNLGYKKAAEETTDEQLKSIFMGYSQQRAGFLTEVNGLITRFGGNPEHSGTVKGSIYRQWMDVKATFTGTDRESIINSCLYGEEWAHKAYKDALDSNELPMEVRTVVENQYRASQEAYRKLQQIKSTVK